MEDMIGILLRGSIVYLYILAAARLSGKRSIGQSSPLDFMVGLLLGDLFDDVIWGEVAVSTALVAISTIVIVHILAQYGLYISQTFDRLVNGQRVLLVRDGRCVEEGLRKEHMREEEVREELRLFGEDQLEPVAAAYLETSGQVSLLRREPAEVAQKQDLPRLKELLQ